jgi:hypothetical protein
MGCHVGVPLNTWQFFIVKCCVVRFGLASGKARMPAAEVSSRRAICFFHASGSRIVCPRLL